MNIILSNAWCVVGEARGYSYLRMNRVLPVKSSRFQGFTLLEMLVAMTVAAILTTVSLNVYSTFHHGVVETNLHYEQFVSEKVKELRCHTRFVRGLPLCDTASGESWAFRASRKSCAFHDSIRLRF